MTQLKIVLDHGQGAWSDLPAKRQTNQVFDLSDDPRAVLQIAEVKRGTLSGATSVLLRFDMPDGRVVIAQTTLKLLRSAVDAIEASAP